MAEGKNDLRLTDAENMKMETVAIFANGGIVSPKIERDFTPPYPFHPLPLDRRVTVLTHGTRWTHIAVANTSAAMRGTCCRKCPFALRFS